MKQAARSTPPKATSADIAEAPKSAVSKDAVGRRTGIDVFDPTREQGVQHPQVALNRRKKSLPSNGVCLKACVRAGVGRYKKTCVSEGR